MSDFEKRRDEAARKHGENYIRPTAFANGYADSFLIGADWARKDCAARAERLEKTLKAILERSMQHEKCNPSVNLMAREALAAFAKESL